MVYVNACLAQIYPFNYTDGWMFIKMKVNDSIDGNFIFDTGASLAILDKDFVVKNQIKTEDGSFKMNGVGEGGGELSGFIRQLKFSHGKLNRIFKAIRVINLRKLLRHGGIDGIIGINLFDNKRVEFNFENNSFIIHNEIFQPLQNGYTPASIIANMNRGELFYYDVKIDLTDTIIKNILVFDTGNAGRISLHTKCAETYNLQNLNTIAEITSFNIGVGGGNSKNNYIYAKEIDLDNYIINKYLISYSLDKKGAHNTKSNNKINPVGLLGMKVIKNFNWFFDFKNDKFYLKPNNNFNKENESEFKFRNLRFNTDGKEHYFVRSILKYYEDEVNIHAGDTIHQIYMKGYGVIPTKLLVDSIGNYLNKVLSVTLRKGENFIDKDVIVKDTIIFPINK
jgi:hypothetical protein